MRKIFIESMSLKERNSDRYVKLGMSQLFREVIEEEKM